MHDLVMKGFLGNKLGLIKYLDKVNGVQVYTHVHVHIASPLCLDTRVVHTTHDLIMKGFPGKQTWSYKISRPSKWCTSLYTCACTHSLAPVPGYEASTHNA